MKKRNWAIAGFSSLVIPGFGQLYNTQSTKALVFLFVALLLLTTLFCTPLALYFETFLLVVISILGFRIYVVIDAIFVAIRSKSLQLCWYNRWYGYLGFAIIAHLLFFGARPVVEEFRRVELYRIPTQGMKPTLVSGDFIAVDRWSYKGPFSKPTRSIRRGDVVTYKPPESPSAVYVSRCVAVGGDTVEVRDGVLFVNGSRAAPSSRIDEGPRRKASGDRLPGEENMAEQIKDLGPLPIPSDSLYIVGDNRDSSYDSRFFGPVSTNAVIGQVRYIYFSWGQEALLPRFTRMGREQ